MLVRLDKFLILFTNVREKDVSVAYERMDVRDGIAASAAFERRGKEDVAVLAGALDGVKTRSAPFVLDHRVGQDRGTSEHLSGKGEEEQARVFSP